MEDGTVIVPPNLQGRVPLVEAWLCGVLSQSLQYSALSNNSSQLATRPEYSYVPHLCKNLETLLPPPRSCR